MALKPALETRMLNALKSATEPCHGVEMIEETCASRTNLLRVDPFGIAGKAPHVDSSLKRTAASESIGFVTGLATIHSLAHEAVALVVVHGRHRRIDRQLVEVRPAEA